jgi:hypothetical protein
MTVGGKSVSRDPYSGNLADALNAGETHLDISWADDAKQPQKLLLSFAYSVQQAPSDTLALDEKIFLRLDYAENTNDKFYFPCHLEPVSGRTTTDGWTYVEEELELRNNCTLFNISINKSGGTSVLINYIELRASFGDTMLETGTGEASSDGVYFAFQKAYKDVPTPTASIVAPDGIVTSPIQLVCEPQTNGDGYYTGVTVRSIGGTIPSGALVAMQAHCTGSTS